jgi:Fe-S oxidoreductase
MLDMAKIYLRRIISTLEPQIQAGIPMVVLEPSCASVFRDELHSLFPDDPMAKKLREQTLLLSEFLEKKAPDYQLPRMRGKALVQGHCHHKSVLRFDDENSVLKKLGLDANVLASGCCGMAGSFGFEKDKYDVSVAVGERKLLPEVRQAPLSTMIMADGFSCREQIAQETKRHALHLAEVIRMGQLGQPEMYPEDDLVERRKADRRRARVQALAALAAIGVGSAVACKLLTKR